jgi:hypothetical protein
MSARIVRRAAANASSRLTRGDPVGAELDDVAVVDAEEHVGAFDRHAVVDLLELDHPELLFRADVDRALRVELQLLLGNAEQLGVLGHEAAQDALDVGDPGSGAGKSDPHRSQVVAAAGQHGHARALDQVRAVGPGVPADIPGGRVLGEETAEGRGALGSGAAVDVADRHQGRLDLQRRRGEVRRKDRGPEESRILSGILRRLGRLGWNDGE